MKSKRPIGAWRRHCIRISIQVTGKPKRNSRASRWPDKRARFDRGEIDASGAERPQHRYYRDFAEGGASHPYVSDAGFADFAGADSEVWPHPIFTRKGDDIYIELPISLKEAVLGGKVKVPTPSGAVTMTVPKWVNTGKGKGVPHPDGGRGDEHVTLKVMLPDTPDPELEKLIAQWRPASVDAPRRAMGV